MRRSRILCLVVVVAVACTAAKGSDVYEQALEGHEVYTYIETKPRDDSPLSDRGETADKMVLAFTGACVTDHDYCLSVGIKGAEELENEWQAKRDLCSISEGLEEKPVVLVYKSIAEYPESLVDLIECRLWEAQKGQFTDEFIAEKMAEKAARERQMRELEERLGLGDQD